MAEADAAATVVYIQVLCQLHRRIACVNRQAEFPASRKCARGLFYGALARDSRFPCRKYRFAVVLLVISRQLQCGLVTVDPCRVVDDALFENSENSHCIIF